VIDWEAANAADYQIQGSADGNSWTTLASRTGLAFGTRTDTLAVSGSYRYVRMYGTKRSVGNSWGYSIWSFKVYGASDPLISYPGYTGSYPGYTLKLDERFNNLNTQIWKKGDGAVGSESMCRFTPNGVQVVNGNLELVVRNEFVQGSYSFDHQAEKPPYNFSCGELRTVPAKRIKYGRIEARIKAPARATASGYISSLFTYYHDGSPRIWEEIDVELEGGRPDMFQANYIYGENVPDWWSTGRWGRWEHKINIAPADQWRVYAIEWTPTGMRWFVDGVLVKTLNQDWMDCNPSCVAPQVSYTPVPRYLTDLMVNFWIPNDSIQNDFGGNKYRNVYPMTAQYDWVRIYSLDSNPLTNW
jgi:beta-glucanase (GH16 family)